MTNARPNKLKIEDMADQQNENLYSTKKEISIHLKLIIPEM